MSVWEVSDSTLDSPEAWIALKLSPVLEQIASVQALDWNFCCRLLPSTVEVSAAMTSNSLNALLSQSLGNNPVLSQTLFC